MGLLDGDILGRALSAAMAPIYASATLTRIVLSDDGNGGGNAVASHERCLVQVDAATEAMRQQAGYTGTDVRIIILDRDLTAPVDTDCQLTTAGRTYLIASVSMDPARSHFECRGQLRS